MDLSLTRELMSACGNPAALSLSSAVHVIGKFGTERDIPMPPDPQAVVGEW